jgi:hypothetical protein
MAIHKEAMTITEAELILRQREILTDDEGVYRLAPYVRFSEGDTQVTLDGEFDADTLMALAVYMDATRG